MSKVTSSRRGGGRWAADTEGSLQEQGTEEWALHAQGSPSCQCPELKGQMSGPQPPPHPTFLTFSSSWDLAPGPGHPSPEGRGLTEDAREPQEPVNLWPPVG